MSKLLGAGGNGPAAGQPQRFAGFAQEAGLLLGRIEQHDIQVRPRDGERNSREPSARPDVNQPCAHGNAGFDDAQRIGEMLDRDAAGIGDAGEVHALVRVEQELGEALQPLDGLGVELDVQGLHGLNQSAAKFGAISHRAWLSAPDKAARSIRLRLRTALPAP